MLLRKVGVIRTLEGLNDAKRIPRLSVVVLFLTTSSRQQVSSKPQVTQTSSQRFEPKPVVAFESKVSRSK